jgi:hypothetical protein
MTLEDKDPWPPAIAPGIAPGIAPAIAPGKVAAPAPRVVEAQARA